MLEILDTAGSVLCAPPDACGFSDRSYSQEEFSAMRDQWFRQGDAFILLYNITLRTTFEEIQKFYDLVLKAKDADRPGPMILGTYLLLSASWNHIMCQTLDVVLALCVRIGW